MQIKISPVAPAYVWTPPIQPSPAALPAIPKLNSKEEEWRGGAPFILAPVGSKISVLANAGAGTLGVALAQAGRLAGGARAAAALVVGGGLLCGFLGAESFSAPEERPAYADVVVSMERPPALVLTPAPAPQSPGLIIPEPVSGRGAPEEAPAARPAAPPEAAAAASDASAAVRPDGLGSAAELGEALRDAPAALKRHAPARQSLTWNGVAFQPQAGPGGAFPGMALHRQSTLKSHPAQPQRAPGPPTALRTAAQHLSASPHGQRLSSERAIGQLRLAQTMSASGARQSGFEAARQGASDAFEQTKSVGGAGLSAEAAPNTGLGSGAPDLTAPSVGPGENKTPYQEKVDDAKKGIDMAKMLTILAIVLMGIGVILLAFAKKLAAMIDPASKTLALKLQLLGAGLLLGGIVALAAGQAMKKKAQDEGKSVADQAGQKAQGDIIDKCADQATAPMSCVPPDVDQPANGVHAAVEAEGAPSFGMGAAAPTQASGGPIAAGR